MPQVITKGHRQLVDEANAIVEEIGVEAAKALYDRPDVQFVDIRDIRELEREGHIPGAFHCPRGMLEFWIDPESPYARPQFQQDRHFVFFCAGGLRSALAARAAQEMGLKPVSHIRGGYGAWRAAGYPTETLPPKAPKP